MDDAIRELEEMTGVKYSDEQLAVLNHKGGMCIMACAGSGKALVNGTLVREKNGLVKIEKLKIGDEVYGTDGKMQKVIGVFPQGKKRVYVVKTSNGDEVECCSEHLWSYLEDGEIKTEKLENIIEKVRQGGIELPLSEPLLFEGVKAEKLEIDPYIFGASTVNCRILSSGIGILELNDENQMDIAVERVYLDKNFRENRNIEENYGKTYENFEIYSREIGNTLSSYGMSKPASRYIPEKYKYSSIDNRIKLLKGIIYSSLSDEGEIIIDGEQLSRDVVQVITELGMTVKSEEIADRRYKLEIGVTNELRDRITTDEKSKCNRENIATLELGVASSRITEIEEKEEEKEMTCIKVSNENGLFLLEKGVVTHNTTILTHLIAKRCLTGEIDDVSKLLCTTYSRAGKSELQERLVLLLNNLGLDSSIKIKTIHATYLEVLKKFNIKLGNICSEGKKAQLIDESLREMRIRLEEEDKETLGSLISYQVNNLMTDSNLVQSSAYTLENFSQEKYTELRTRYTNKKQQLKLIDFDDLQMYMYMFMVAQPNQEMVNYCKEKYKYIYVDEFQDTSKIQFEVLRKMAGDNIVVIGDDDQSIYGWRGADPSIILNVCGYFDIKKFVLSTNYRCCGEIVKLAAQGIKNNVKRVEKDMKPYNEGGTLRICNTPKSLFGITKDVFVHIKSLIDNGVNPSDIVVLCRNNRQSAILSNILVDNEIYYKAATESMRFTKLPLYRDIKAVFELVLSDSDVQAAKQVLWEFVPFMGKKGSEAITALMEGCGMTIKDSLWHIIMSYTIMRNYCEMRHTSTVKFRVPAPLEAKVSSIVYGYMNKTEIQEGLVELYYTLCLEKEVDRAIKLFRMMCKGLEFQYKNPDRYRLLEGVCSYVIYKIRKFGVGGALDSLKRAEVYDSGDIIYDDVVELSTIHGAKGREWKHVILLADDNVSFPNFYAINKMSENGIPEENLLNWMDEERRLHYVAFTRAKEELAIFANSEELSIFTLECLGLESDNDKIISYAIRGLDSSVLDFSRECIEKYKYDLTEQRVRLFPLG